MDVRRRLPVLSRAAGAALALVAAGCWDDIVDTTPAPPAPAYVSIDDHDARVESPSAWLEGDVSCPDCGSSGWQYGTCPMLECPSVEGSTVRWSNRSTGGSGDAAHGTVAVCHCPWPWGYGYCYSVCSHVWWAGIPLAFGDNDIEVTATLPGAAPGQAATLVRRVPVTPAWLPAVAGPGQVTLAWTASEGATSYNLYWSTTAYIQSGLCTKIANVASPYTHAGLAAGVPHYYFVTALAGAAEGFDSQRLTVTPQ